MNLFDYDDVVYHVMCIIVGDFFYRTDPYAAGVNSQLETLSKAYRELIEYNENSRKCWQDLQTAHFFRSRDKCNSQNCRYA